MSEYDVFYPLKHARELCIISITQEGHSPPKTHTQNSHKHTHTTIRRKQDTNGPFQQWATIKLPGPGVLSPENDLAAAPGMPLLQQSTTRCSSGLSAAQP